MIDEEDLKLMYEMAIQGIREQSERPAPRRRNQTVGPQPKLPSSRLLRTDIRRNRGPAEEDE